MSTPEKVSNTRDESNSNAECESLKKQNSRMAGEGNMSNVPSVHVDESICIPFRRCGICSFGEKCPYIHARGKGENRESSARTILDGESTDVPSRGIGFEESSGSSAIKIETRKPKKPAHFLTKIKTKLSTLRGSDGTCVYGEKCTFAHGIAELSSLDSPNPPESQRSADISAPARNVPARKDSSNPPESQRSADISAPARNVPTRKNSSNPPESQRSADISAPDSNVPANETVTIAPADRWFKLNDLKRNSRIYGDWIE